MTRIKTKQIPEIKLELLEKQDWICPLCTEEIETIDDACLDHDHKTGALRAVLHRNCNAMEGKIWNCANRGKRNGTRHNFLRNVLIYWKDHKQNKTGYLHPSHKTEDEKRIRRNKKAAKRRKAKKEGSPVLQKSLKLLLNQDTAKKPKRVRDRKI